MNQFEKTIVKLPDTEFEVMQEIWSLNPPITTSMLMNGIGLRKNWKLQTLTTLLNRLIERRFLRTEKLGKERTYYPIILKEEYIEYETTQFVQRYHENSMSSLMSAFYSGSNKLSKNDIDELTSWLKQKEEEQL